ncbi:MAG: MlaE family lipid ABC transporter permease subunit [Pseudomonadota bacterium]|nr:MlaE family lipid ABC transporter permease subunit [Pseudomonadota bacterium]
MFNGLIQTCFRLGQAFWFLLRIITAVPKRKEHVRGVIQQIYTLGNQTLLIILVAGAFIGMVITLQGYMSLEQYGASSEIGGLTAYSIYRELGPVVTGLLFSGRVGSLLAAEIGLMQINQQFTCLEMMAINSNRLILFPRFIAVFISVPALNILFCLSAVMSSYLICTASLGISDGIFWNSLEYSTLFVKDVIHGVNKSCIFGAIIAWVSLYQGMYTEKSRLGLAKATTAAVVSSSLYILAIDYVFTALARSFL